MLSNRDYKTDKIPNMKRLLTTLVTMAVMTACGSNQEGVHIDDQSAENAAYDLSYELTTAVLEATNYEEFKAARQALESHEEAFRTQIGGDSYLIFLEECNIMLGEI